MLFRASPGGCRAQARGSNNFRGCRAQARGSHNFRVPGVPGAGRVGIIRVWSGSHTHSVTVFVVRTGFCVVRSKVAGSRKDTEYQKIGTYGFGNSVEFYELAFKESDRPKRCIPAEGA